MPPYIKVMIEDVEESGFRGQYIPFCLITARILDSDPNGLPAEISMIEGISKTIWTEYAMKSIEASEREFISLYILDTGKKLDNNLGAVHFRFLDASKKIGSGRLSMPKERQNDFIMRLHIRMSDYLPARGLATINDDVFKGFIPGNKEQAELYLESL